MWGEGEDDICEDSVFDITYITLLQGNDMMFELVERSEGWIRDWRWYDGLLDCY